MIYLPLATGNSDVDTVNSHFNAGVGLFFQSVWDITSPWLGALIVIAVVVRLGSMFFARAKR